MDMLQGIATLKSFGRSREQGGNIRAIGQQYGDTTMDVLRTAFAVGAADDSISAAESAELNEIGKELGFRADEVDSVRYEFRDKLAAIQAMRAARGA